VKYDNPVKTVETYKFNGTGAAWAKHRPRRADWHRSGRASGECSEPGRIFDEHRPALADEEEGFDFG